MGQASKPARPAFERPSGYIPTLDGWRAIAIAGVLINHAPNFPQGRILSRVEGWGALGVDLFFALSGILICSRLLDEERLHGSISIKGFYLRRIFRIFPAAYLYLAVIALLFTVHFVPAGWNPLWCAALFVRNYYSTFAVEGFRSRITGHFWSLGVEEHFYLMLPAILVFIPRHRKLALASLTLACFLWVSIYLVTTPPMMRSLMWETRSDLRLQCLFFPAFLALLLNEGRSRAWLQRFVTPRAVALVLVLLVLGGIAKHFLFAAHNAQLPPAIALPDPANPGGFLLQHESQAPGGIVFLVPLFFPFMVIATMLHPRTWISQVLEWKPLRVVGRMSYSLYLWQELFYVPVDYSHWPIYHLQRPGWLGLALSFACAAISYKWIEKPIIRLGHKLFPPASAGHRDLSVQPQAASRAQST